MACLADELALFLNDVAREWVVHAKALDVLLALAAEDVVHELAAAITHRLTGLLIDVDVGVALEGIGAVLDVRYSEWDIRSAVFGEVDLLYAGVVLGVKDRPPGDAIFVFGERFVHALAGDFLAVAVGGDLLLLDVF